MSTSASISGIPQHTVNALTSVMTHTTWSEPGMRIMDPMDESFGQSIADIPPPYSEESAIPLPEYTLHLPEPLTLAMYFFKFGFLFPPFWIFGAFILMSPLREPLISTTDSVPAWVPEKTEDERKQIIATLREVELKWAKRCRCPILILTVLAVSGGLAAWAVLRR